jgi:hypothetical protein
MTENKRALFPEGFIDAIEYNVHWRGERSFFMLTDDYREYKGSWDKIKISYPAISIAMAYHPTTGDEGIFIGTKDRDQDAEIAAKLDLQSGVLNRKINQQAKQKKSYAGSSHWNNKYPWDKLKDVGDYFIIKGASVKSISTLVGMHMRNTNDGRILRVHQIPPGVLVICICNSEHSFKNIVGE